MAKSEIFEEIGLRCLKSIIMHTEHYITDEMRKKIPHLMTKEDVINLLEHKDLKDKYEKIWISIKASNDESYLLGKKAVH